MRSADSPLSGRAILVTRPADRAQRLAAMIEEAGGVAHVYPAIRILPPLDEAAARDRLRRIAEYDPVVFVSPTAAERAFAMLGAWPSGMSAAAVGAGTRATLEALGVAKVLAPDSGADSEALLALPQLGDMRDRRVLVVRGEGGREVLAQTLRERGAEVAYAECYRRAPPGPPSPTLARALEEGRIDGATVSSTTAVENLFAAFTPAQSARLRRTALFVPHERVAQAARAHGAAMVLVSGPTDQEVLERLVAYFKGP